MIKCIYFFFHVIYIYILLFCRCPGETRWVWFCLDYFSDFLYVLDIVFHIRTGYLEDGVLQTDATKLRNHYTNSTTFYMDILCLLPLDFLYLSIGFNSILRSFRLVKIYRWVNKRWHQRMDLSFVHLKPLIIIVIGGEVVHPYFPYNYY